MNDILAVFRSRAQAADAVARLKRTGVYASLVNTPKEAAVGCGLSVKFSAAASARARATIARGGYTAFYGYFEAGNIYGRNFIRRIK